MTHSFRPTVYLVDDDDAFRDSLQVLCESVSLETSAFAGGQQFLDVFDPDMRGCLVLDVRMPHMSGLELQRQLEERGCRLPIIFLTGHGDIEMAVSAMKRGAADFLTKPLRHQDLLDSIHAALMREKQQTRAETELDVYRERLARLTPREREVFELVVEGTANKVISSRLKISPRTVELHRSQVMKKMEASSLAGLVRTALAIRRADEDGGDI